VVAVFRIQKPVGNNLAKLTQVNVVD